ncbi:MAG TPA: phosphoribosyltransferase family protein [Candidatus Saccharimonadales bacterium]
MTTNYEAAARELIKVYKFGHQRAAAEALASLMAETFLQLSDLGPSSYLVVSVPTASRRVRERSFDHCAHLASQLAKKLNARHLSALARIGQTRQVGTERSVRLSQPAGKYIVRYPNLVSGRNILLIDDVVTTSATLRAATKALRAAGAARVDALVFAKRL